MMRNTTPRDASLNVSLPEDGRTSSLGSGLAVGDAANAERGNANTARDAKKKMNGSFATNFKRLVRRRAEGVPDEPIGCHCRASAQPSRPDDEKCTEQDECASHEADVIAARAGHR